MNTVLRVTAIGALCAVAFVLPAAAVSPLLKEFEDAFIRLGEMAGPSVVEINAEGSRGRDRDAMEELFRFFESPDDSDEQPEPPARPERPPATATGSGFLFDERGHIITNNHVVDRASKVTVKLHDGTERVADIVGQDPSSDLAVIKIDPTGLSLSPAILGDSESIRVGQFAIAMGSPRGLSQSVSFGHVSGLGRERLSLPDENLRFQNFIQTDAAINLGNSGGPLLNIDGEVIGVNIAIVFGANSIGFAIPVNRVKEIVPQLIDGGKVVRGWLGISIMDVTQAAERDNQNLEDYIQAFGLEDGNGAFVQDVTWEGPAAQADLQREDIIWKIDGQPVKDTLDLINQISAIDPGTTVTLQVWRTGELIHLPIVVGEFPGMQAAQFGKAYLGMHLLELEPEMLNFLQLPEGTKGVVIPAVVDGGPAQEAAIREFDVVVKIAQKPVENREGFKQLLRENAEPGKTLLLHVMRRGTEEEQRKFVKVPDNFRMD